VVSPPSPEVHGEGKPKRMAEGEGVKKEELAVLFRWTNF
jgi:hypothetical protein